MTNIENSSDSASYLSELSEQIPQNNLNPKDIIKQNYVVDEKKSSLIDGVVKYMNLGLLVFGLTLAAIFFMDYLVKNPFLSLPNVPKTETPTLAVKIGSPTYLSAQSDFIPTLESTETPSPIPTLGIGSTMISEKDGMPLVFVPAGKFTMGSDLSSDEQPVHQIALVAFWIDQTEVTNAKYAKCVADGGCTHPSSTSSYTHDSYYGNSEFDDYPVIYVDWNQANVYCSWAGRRLPTEAEWEKAARGTDGRTYPWGEEISCTYANYFDGSKYCVGDTAPVSSYTDGASIYGALNMAGNVWEWVSSLYQDNPYVATDGREDFASSGSRVLRGGAWDNYGGGNVRSAYRDGYVPASTDDSVGFRCSLSYP